MTDTPVHFPRLALIGIGLLGSSLARAVKKLGLADHIAIATRSPETLAQAQELNLGDSYTTDPAEAARDADLVMICVPMGAFSDVAKAIAPALKPGAIVSDVGSSKRSAIEDIRPHLPKGIHLVPGHPIAGTEHSGPEAGFAELFQGHWCVLTPEPGTDSGATNKVEALWRAVGMMVEVKIATAP